PLLSQLLPMTWNGGPVVGRLVGWEGPQEEDGQHQDHGTKREQGQEKRRAAAVAQHEREDEIGDERADETDAEQIPPAVDVLHDEILLRPEIDLVAESEEVRAAGDQSERGERDGHELNELQEHNRNSPCGGRPPHNSRASATVPL